MKIAVMQSPLSLVNLQALSSEKQEREVQRLVNEDALHTFDLEKGPLFRTTLLQLGDELQILSGLHLTPISFEDTIATFNLTLSMEETSQGLEGVLKYNTDLWERATIERMIGHFQTLLEGIVEHPQHLISELPLLTAQEQQQLLAWNDTTVEYPAVCIHHLLEAQVERTPLRNKTIA